MTSPFSNPAFLTFLAAQAAPLAAVGLLTMALALAACRIDGASAGKFLGLLLVLKLAAYVVLAPLAEALLRSMPRKPVTTSLDLGRMLLLMPMAFAATTLRVATLTFALFVLAAAIAPLCQSVIPDVLPETRTIVGALAWSRIAFALDMVLGSSNSAALLGVLWAEHSFPAAALASVGSILALSAIRFPARAFGDGRKPLLERAIIGLRIRGHTPRLRDLFLWIPALPLALARVPVNSVVFAGQRPGDAARHYPILMTFYGLGAASGAALVPTMDERLGERMTMMSGVPGLAARGPAILLPPTHSVLLTLRAGFGLTSSLALARGGPVITRSAQRRDRPAVFAATWAWPADGPLQRMHRHPDLPADHQHLRDIPVSGPGHARRHDCHIDDLHPGRAGSAA